MRVYLLVAIFGAVSIACATEHRLLPAGGFSLTLGRAHPLSGRIWNCSRRAFSTGDELRAAVAEARFVVLGETHDNRDHHALQTELLQAFLAAHPDAAVGFEMLDEDQGALLAAHPAATSAELSSTVNWAGSGWPAFALYRPLFDVSLAAHARIVAAHPSAEHVRASMSGVPADQARALGSNAQLPAAQQQAQRDEIRASHCGHASEAMLTAMQNAQTYKDAFMAHAMFQARVPALLIAGRGHARNDRGVPWYMRRLGIVAPLSIALVEVDDAHAHAGEYETQAFDFLVFTPRVTDQDACEEFKQQLEAMRQHSAGN